MTSQPSPPELRPRDRRFVDLAVVLSRAARDDELTEKHALRILRHELRVMNVNSSMKVATRSEGAQAVIDRYAEAGTPIPKNGSGDALHCDHVYALSEHDLRRLRSREAWTAELARLQTVVCVTAAENYRLEQVERQGVTGWDKYEKAGIRLLRPAESTMPDAAIS